MRIISWNANYNAHKRTFLEDAEFLFAEGADVVVLSEVARPVTEELRHIAWIGRNNPGLGIIARNGYSLTPSDLNSGAPTLFGGFAIKGAVLMNLLAAWPVQYPAGSCYSKLLNTALDHFAGFLAGDRYAIVGDLNSSSLSPGRLSSAAGPQNRMSASPSITCRRKVSGSRYKSTVYLQKTPAPPSRSN